MTEINDNGEEYSSSILDVVLHQKQVHVADIAIDERLKQVLNILPERDKEIIQCHFGLFGSPFCTLEEIGHRFNITRERVRQIEKSSINVLRKSDVYAKYIKPFEEGVIQILEENGGAMEESELFDEIMGSTLNKFGNVSNFIFRELFTRVEEIESNKFVKKGWRIKLSSWEFIETTLKVIEQIINEKKEALSDDDLFTSLEQSEYYKNNAGKLSQKVIFSLLSLSQRIKKSYFGLWGLSVWPNIVPKKMSDKIYLAMKKNGQPMHFRDIARAINEMKFDQKIAHPATIHNELIINKKYVLIGRGIYALSEWGFEPGVVADVIIEILNNSKMSLTRDQIVAQVLKKRQVKIATIHLALTNKNKFQRLPTGEYTLVKQNENQPSLQ